MVGVWVLLLFVQLKTGNFGFFMHQIGPYETQMQCQEAHDKLVPMLASETKAKIVSVCMEVGAQQ